MITAIDTNILFDILILDNPRRATAIELLEETYRNDSLIIGEAIYAELAAVLTSQRELDAFLLRTGVRFVPSRPEALYAASRAWRACTQRRGQEFQCPRCGSGQSLACSACGYQLRPRLHILPDS